MPTIDQELNAISTPDTTIRDNGDKPMTLEELIGLLDLEKVEDDAKAQLKTRELSGGMQGLWYLHNPKSQMYLQERRKRLVDWSTTQKNWSNERSDQLEEAITKWMTDKYVSELSEARLNRLMERYYDLTGEVWKPFVKTEKLDQQVSASVETARLLDEGLSVTKLLKK